MHEHPRRLSRSEQAECGTVLLRQSLFEGLSEPMRIPGKTDEVATRRTGTDGVPGGDPIAFFEGESPHAETTHGRKWLILTAGAGIVVGLMTAGVLFGMMDTSAAVPEKEALAPDLRWQRPVISAKGDMDGELDATVLAASIPTRSGRATGPAENHAHTARLMTTFAGVGTPDGWPSSSVSPSILQASLTMPEGAGSNETVIMKSPPPEPEDRTFVLAPGESLAGKLVKLGVPPTVARALVQALEPVHPSSLIRAGQKISVTLDRQQDFYGTEVIYPVYLSFRAEDGKRVVVESDEDGNFMVRSETLKAADDGKGSVIRPKARPGTLATRKNTGPARYAEAPFIRARGRISSSLYAAARDQNVPDYIISQMMRAFSYSIDLQRQVAKGDTFDILYGAPMSGSSKRRKVLYYAALNMRGRKIVYYRFTTPGGRTDYFDEKGRSASKGLMATPISGARITSGFGMRRHPVLGYTKMHTGIDFGAPRGTPIRAAGSGTVIFAGWRGGYGRTVMIRHDNGYVTLYAHQSRIARGIRKGVRVNQGQIIGYVGASGRVTGPHLHFEVRIKNRPVNPRRVRTAHNVRLKGKALEAFRKQKARILALLKQAPSADLVARR